MGIAGGEGKKSPLSFAHISFLSGRDAGSHSEHKREQSCPYIGPTLQDYMEAFHLGRSP